MPAFGFLGVRMGFWVGGDSRGWGVGGKLVGAMRWHFAVVIGHVVAYLFLGRW